LLKTIKRIKKNKKEYNNIIINNIKMVNYANGKIYKICSINDEDECYIGSTTQHICKRMAKHRHEYINKPYGSTNSKILFDKYGIENCKIVLITKFPCNCKEELEAEEAKHIKNNNCVNKCIPGRTKEQIAEYQKQYKQDHKEYYTEYSKKYYQDNAEYKKQYSKQYRQDNKDKITESKKQYRQDNKDKIAEKANTKYHCICGSMTAITHKARHERTAKHIKGEQDFFDGCEEALQSLYNK
jgi:hypothetical protein